MLQLNQSTDILKFIAFLEEALPYVDYITPTDINSGGCGVFAQALYRVLKENGILSEIYACYFDPKEDSCEKDLINFINSNSDKLSTAGADHIILKVGDLFLDSSGIVTKAYLMARRTIKLTEEQLDILVTKGKWNPIFDRSLAPTIQNNLNTVFSNYNDYTLGCLITKDLLKQDITYSPYTISKLRELRKRASVSVFNSLFS